MKYAPAYPVPAARRVAMRSNKSCSSEQWRERSTFIAWLACVPMMALFAWLGYALTTHVVLLLHHQLLVSIAFASAGGAISFVAFRRVLLACPLLTRLSWWSGWALALYATLHGCLTFAGKT